FALLKEVGGECAGAVSVYPPGVTPNFNEKPTFHILTDKEAYKILSGLDKRPMWVGTEEVRISGAGAQNKLIIALVDGQIAIPTRNTPSTHIIKPAISDLESTVQNEFFCMKLAQAVGLPVPHVEIRWIEGEAYYLIERYDRIKNKKGTAKRLHQEDLCQALHIPPELKYENEGGPGIQQCFSLLDERMALGTMSGKNKITLLEGFLFNFLIGNGDAHGKNFSLLYEENAESLAPFYDLMCTMIYSNAYKAKMAMKIGGKYKFSEVVFQDIEKMGVCAGFRPDFIGKKWTTLLLQLPDAAHEVCTSLNNHPETASKVYEKIVKLINVQCAHHLS
ncbi:MAG TPA: HipA domain-containing protein, partial [Gammaproteobacteria bacterium]|nr:HipA domain-containing protein [Gammaproteobacteria bacterium]